MGSFVMAWLVGEGIVSYRSVKVSKAPPGPGQLLLSSGAFVMLALLAEVEQARRAAILMAWGLDIAAFMNLFNLAPKASSAFGPWPPPLAPNTVIIPTGKGGQSESSVSIQSPNPGASTYTGSV